MSGQRNTVLAIGIASVAAALASGWVASRPTTQVKPARGDVTRAPSSATPTTSAPVEDPAEEHTQPKAPRPQVLGDLLIDTAPEGFVEISPESGPTGPFDLESFVQHSDNPELDRAVLSENQFLRGHVRSWQRLAADGPHRIVASVFEFEDVSQAVVFMIHKREQTIAEDGGVRFPVESGIGVRFVHRIDGAPVHGYTVAFHEGNLVFYIGALYPSEQPHDEILAFETRQRELLDRSSDNA